MAEAGISAPAEGRVKISDDYLQAHKSTNNSSADIDIERLTPVAAFVYTQVPATGRNGRFEPRGVSVDGAVDSDDNPDFTATSGIINGWYKNDPDSPGRANLMTERFTCGITHPCRFKKIRPYETTARGIIIKA